MAYANWLLYIIAAVAHQNKSRFPQFRFALQPTENGMNMLADGFYKVNFTGLLPGVGGLVTLEGGIVRGGDGQFLYAGKLTMLDASRMQANIRVSAFAPDAHSVFGGAEKHFTLNLHGNIIGSGVFQVSGPADLPGAPNITINGTRIAALDLA